MKKLRPGLSRFAALLLLAVAGAILVAVVALPLREDYRTTEARIVDSEFQLARYRHVAERLPGQRAVLAALRQRQASQDGFLAGSNETLIGAELQGRVKTIVETAQGELRSTQVLPTREEGGFRRIAVRGEMIASVAAVQAILYRLETTAPTLFLDALDFRPQRNDRRDGSDDAPLEVSFEVYGYVRSPR